MKHLSPSRFAIRVIFAAWFVTGWATFVCGQSGGLTGVREVVEEAVGQAKEQMQPEVPSYLRPYHDAAHKLADSVKEATTKLRQVAQTDEQRLQALDDISAVLRAALASMSKDGEMYRELQRAIESTDQSKDELAPFITDPSVDGELRDGYAQLVANLKKQLDQLYDKKILLDKQRNSLEQKLTKMVQQKQFISAAMRVNQLEQANLALSQVIQSMVEVERSMDELLVGVVASPEQVVQ